MSPLEICQFLENTAGSIALRESLWVFPIVETTHVIGLVFSVGTVFWFDLRLLGVAFRHYSVSEAFAYVQPWMSGGFAMMMLTGAVLFYAHPVDAFESGYFRVKLVLLVLAGMNMGAFHATIDRHRASWDHMLVPPLQARLAGAASLVLWFGIVAVGRMMAYSLL